MQTPTERAWTFKTFPELSPEAAQKAISDDRIFCRRIINNPRMNPLTDKNLYHENGRLAVMTITERNKWFPQKQKENKS